MFKQLYANGIVVKENSICGVLEQFHVSSCGTISSWLYAGTLISMPSVSRFKHGVTVGLCIFILSSYQTLLTDFFQEPMAQPIANVDAEFSIYSYFI